MNNIKIFLDDVRHPLDASKYMHTRIGTKNLLYLEDWIIVKNYKEFKGAIDIHKGNISHISFDHDLADEHYDDMLWENNDIRYKEMTGKECAEYMMDIYNEEGLDLPNIYIHSMNPIGCERIKNTIIRKTQ